MHISRPGLHPVCPQPRLRRTPPGPALSFVPNSSASRVSRACPELVEGDPCGNVMMCHAMSWRCVAASSFLHRSRRLRLAAGFAAGAGSGSVAIIRASFQAKGGTGVPVLRAFRVCGQAGPRARIAAARFARVIARARRRAHLARPFPPGSFSRPQTSLSAEKPKGGPGSRLSLLSFYHTSPQVKPVREQKWK